MPTSYEIREKLEICLPNLRNRLEDTKTLAELGLDSIDLVELFCFIQSEYRVDPATVRIGAETRVVDLLTVLAERTSFSRKQPKESLPSSVPENAGSAPAARGTVNAGNG
jgi:acyl carrier protein